MAELVDARALGVRAERRAGPIPACGTKRSFMRRLFIIRKDLHLAPGKLSAMIAHCAEAFWTRLIAGSSTLEGGAYRTSFMVDKATMEDYVRGSFVKTVCEAKNLTKLMKVEEIAKEMNLVKDVDYGFIDDECRTDLTPEFTDENGKGYCRVGVWFRPLPDEDSHRLSKGYQLYR